MKRFVPILMLALAVPAWVVAQPGVEPELQARKAPTSPYSNGLRNGMAFSLTLNNFGFGLGAEYRRTLSPSTDMLVEWHIGRLRDITEQNYQSYFGQQIIPNKYNQVFTFPLTVGVKHRIFSEALSDNFRVYVTGSMGASPAFVYPYFERLLGRYVYVDDPSQTITLGPLPGRIREQGVYDALSGWNEGYWTWGTAGQVGLGADFGSDFKSLQSLRIGVAFQHYAAGIQVMEPARYLGTTADGIDVVERYKGKQTLFVTPMIHLVLGGMW